MGSFGERLKREREMRAISIDEIASATKIGARSLKALEDEDFDKLPGGIFNKGFVRAYAKFLGIDEEQAVADYMLAAGDPDLPLPAPTAQTDSAGVPLSPPRSGFMTYAIVAIALVATLAGWWFYNERLRQEQNAPLQMAQPEAASETTTAETSAPESLQLPTTGSETIASSPATSEQASTTTASPATTAPTGTATPVATAPAAELKQTSIKPLGSGTIDVQLRARKQSWVEIKADGKLLLEAVLNENETRAFKATEQMVVKVGNAGGVDVTHNGKTLPPLGPEDKLRTLTFTPQGIQQ